ncbi:MAG: glutathione S-transferase N-terminal domain-containing protein [Gallionella sp.]
MKLLGTNTSPYVRKVRLVLLEKNIVHSYLVDAPREAGSQVALANPLARIPALILDDQTCVFDSPVIAEYVDSLNDTPILIPRDNALERMYIKRWEALADGVMDSAVLVRNEVLRDVDKQDAASIARHNLAITRALAYMSEQMASHTYCAGVAISLADLALVSALIYLDLRQAERDWRSTHLNLAAWFGRMQQRESVRISLQE